MSIRDQVAQVTAEKNSVPVYQGYLAEDYDGLCEYIMVTLSRGSASAGLARISPGAAGSGQFAPAGTPVSVVSLNGHLEIVSLGSKVGSTYVVANNADANPEPTLSPVSISAASITDYTGNESINQSGLQGAWRKLAFSGGIYNPDFEIPPSALSVDLSADNDLPYWNDDASFPAPSVIHLQVLDTGAAFGKVLRATLDGGRADQDNAWVAQVVPTNLSTETVVTFRYGSSIASSYLLDIIYDWLDKDGLFISRTGGGLILGALGGAAANSINEFRLSSGVAPDNAVLLKIWIGARATGTDATTRYFDILSVGINQPVLNIKIPDTDPTSNDNTSEIYEFYRSLRLRANTGGAAGSYPELILDGSTATPGLHYNGRLLLSSEAALYSGGSYLLRTDGDFAVTAGLITTKVVAGAVSDADFASSTALNGAFGWDTTNHRLYYRRGGAWHYLNETAGFQIPVDVDGVDERICPKCQVEMQPGEAVAGLLDGYMEDKALHGRWAHLRCLQ